MEATEQTIWNHQASKYGNSVSDQSKMADEQKQSRFSNLIDRIYFVVPLIVLSSIPFVDYMVKGELELSLPNILLVLATIMCLVTWSMRVTSELTSMMPVVITAISGTALGMMMVSRSPDLHMHAAASLMIMIIWLTSAPKLKLYIIAASSTLIVAAICYLLFTANLSVQNLITVISLMVSGLMMGVFTQVYRYIHRNDNSPVELLESDITAYEYDSEAEEAFEQEHEADVEQDWPDALKKLNKSLSNINDVDVLFNKMLVQLNETVPYMTGVLSMLQDRELRQTHTFGNENYVIDDIFTITNDQIRGMAESHNDIQHIIEFNDVIKQNMKIYRLDLPVISNEKFIGVVSLVREDEEFSTYERKLANSILFHSMVYLRNARLYEEFKRIKSQGKQSTLYSREQFMDASDKQLQKLNQPRSASLMIVEIDHFEKLMERYGKEVALSVYKSLSESILSGVREQDVVGRHGNDGFLVLLNDMDLLDGKKLAERMREMISKVSCKTAVGKITTTVSIGLASASHMDEDLTSLVQRADMALFVAKESGRNTVKVKL